MGKKRVVLDTNIIISAFGWGGKPEEIIKKVIDKELELVISTKQLAELRNVLEYPRLKFDESKKERILSLVSTISTIIVAKGKVDFVKSDPDDNIILEPACHMKVDYIITGDKKHLLPLRKFKDAEIVSPDEFLKKIT